MRAVVRKPPRGPRLLTIGDLMLDVVVRAGTEVEEGTDVPGEVRFRIGGSAANTARAFAGLGGSATFVGAVGNDRLGAILTRALRAAGVKVRAVERRGRSPRLVAIVRPGGERSFVTDRGVADDLPFSALREQWMRQADAVHLPLYSLLRPPLADAALTAAEQVRGAGGLVSIDLASSRPILDAGAGVVFQILRRIRPDVLFANRDEARALLGAGRRFRSLLEVSPTVVIKEGGAGCRIVWRVGDDPHVSEMQVATRSMRATDTTGAGDAFDAGFLHALLGGGLGPGASASPQLLRRSALAGHRAAASVIRSPRTELLR